jgi:hypothetical protein
VSRGRRRHCPTPTTRYEKPTLSPEFTNESINRPLITAFYGTFVRLQVVRDSNDSYPPPEPSPRWSAAEARTKCRRRWDLQHIHRKEDQARRPRRPTRRLRRPSIEADSRLEQNRLPDPTIWDRSSVGIHYAIVSGVPLVAAHKVTA